MRRIQNTAKIFRIWEEPQILQLKEKGGGRERREGGRRKTMSLVNKLEGIKLER